MKTLALLLFFVTQLSLAETPSKSSKKLDFDAEVIEGVNKQPLDSLEQISEQDKLIKRVHLYNVRTDFKPENVELIRELAETR